MAKYSTNVEFAKAYEFHWKLDQGSFGTMIDCLSKFTGWEYAAKALRGGTDRDIEGIELEIFICQQLEHRNIVRLIEAIEEKNIYYLVCDLMAGGELFDDIARRYTYTEFDASNCIEQVFQGVAYIHSKNIIHGDLSDNNIVLSDRSKNAIVTIANFGSAVLNCDKRSSEYRGTYAFASPEVLISNDIGTYIDMWACGVLLYIMLVGKLPFGEMDGGMIERIRRGVYSFPDVNNSDVIYDEAKDLIRKLLNVDKDSRYTAADALAHPFIRRRTRVTSYYHRIITLENLKVFNVKKTMIHKFRPTPKSKSDAAIVGHASDSGGVKTDFSSESSHTVDAKQATATVPTASNQEETEHGDTDSSNRI